MIELPSGVTATLSGTYEDRPGRQRIYALRAGDSIGVEIRDVGKTGIVQVALDREEARATTIAAQRADAQARRVRHRRAGLKLLGSLLVIGMVGWGVSIVVPMIMSWIHELSGIQIAAGIFLILMVLAALGKIFE